MKLAISRRLSAVSFVLAVSLQFSAHAASPGLFTTSDCTTISGPVAGTSWCYDSTNKQLKYYDGATWQIYGGGITSGVPTGLANVKDAVYGAKGDGKIAYDGAMQTLSAGANVAASSTPTAPAFTTSINNDVVVSAFATNLAWSTQPSVTNRVNVAFASGEYGIWAGDRAVAIAGAAPPVSGSYSSSAGWTAVTIPLKPASGQTISFVAASSTQQASGATLTIGTPTGLQPGDTEIACIAWYTGGGNSLTGKPAQFSATLSYAQDASADQLYCSVHKATSSEPSSYVWTESVSAGGLTGFILDYRNADATGPIDDPLTSASASFSSNDTGKLICADKAAANGSEQCGTVVASGTSTSLVLSFNNSTASAISGAEYRYASNDTTAFQSAINALTSGGTVYVPPGMYGLNGSLAFPGTATVNLIGAGATLSEYYIPFAFGGSSGAAFHQQTSNGGSALWFLTKSLTGGALQYISNVNLGNGEGTTATTFDRVRDLTLAAGAGANFDGGGSDGVDIEDFQHVTIYNCGILNFAGDGIHAVPEGNGFQHWLLGIDIEGNEIALNGGNGVTVGNGHGNVQDIAIRRNAIETNKLVGLQLQAGDATGNQSVTGLSVIDNTIQWNNQTQANPGYQVSILSPVTGGRFQSNYMESGGIANTYGINLGAAPIQMPIGNNFFNSNLAGAVTGTGASQFLMTAAPDGFYDAVGKRFQLGSYWGLEIDGNVESAALPAAATGTSTDAALTVKGIQTGAPVMVANGPTGLTGDIADFQVNGGTVSKVAAGGVMVPPAGTIGGTLPAWSAGLEGSHAVATNCNAACSAGGACTSGGSTHCEIYYNSSAIVETGR